MPSFESAGTPKRARADKSATTIKVKDWVTQVTTQQQVRVVNFLLWAYGGLLIATILIFFLQGFRLWGFSLDVVLLRWLGGATRWRGYRTIGAGDSCNFQVEMSSDR